MTDNVIEFKPQKYDEIYECNCGCQQFGMFPNGNVECVGCGEIMNNLVVQRKDPNGSEDNGK